MQRKRCQIQAAYTSPVSEQRKKKNKQQKNQTVPAKENTRSSSVADKETQSRPGV